MLVKTWFFFQVWNKLDIEKLKYWQYLSFLNQVFTNMYAYCQFDR